VIFSAHAAGRAPAASRARVICWRSRETNGQEESPSEGRAFITIIRKI